MNSIDCLQQGFRLIFKPGFRVLIWTPILINLIIYILLGIALFDLFGGVVERGVSYIPEWLNFLVPVAWTLFTIAMLLMFGYSFALLASVIASPFNGLLAEKVAEHKGVRDYNAPFTLEALWLLIRRSLKRELIKMRYFLPRILLALLATFTIGFIPVIGWLVSFCAFLWAAWSMSIQFIDYPADNDQIGFQETLKRVQTQRLQCLALGAIIILMMGIPVLNLFVIPAAVAGATLFWLERLQVQPHSISVSQQDNL